MLKRAIVFMAVVAFATLFHCATVQAQNPKTTAPAHVPQYSADGQLQLPADYREWIFLSSGIDMSYSPRGMGMSGSMFDNVFVNREAYKSFVETGTWPDKTVLVLEVRGAETKGSINHTGHFQTGDGPIDVEVHLKDESRFPGKWAFFSFDGDKPAKMIPTSASCYSCHQQHGAVDTTFVQFYPTLLPLAKKKSTLSPAFVRESAEAGR